MAAAKVHGPVWYTFGIENKLSFTCFSLCGSTLAFSRERQSNVPLEKML